MHAKVRYHNRMFGRLATIRHIHLVPLAPGILQVLCEPTYKVRDPSGEWIRHRMEISGWGVDYTRNKVPVHSVYFEAFDDIRAELRLYPDTKDEQDVLSYGSMSKDTFTGFYISQALYGRRWDAYCKSMMKGVKNGTRR